MLTQARREQPVSLLFVAVGPHSFLALMLVDLAFSCFSATGHLFVPPETSLTYQMQPPGRLREIIPYELHIVARTALSVKLNLRASELIL